MHYPAVLVRKGPTQRRVPYPVYNETDSTRHGGTATNGILFPSARVKLQTVDGTSTRSSVGEMSWKDAACYRPRAAASTATRLRAVKNVFNPINAIAYTGANFNDGASGSSHRTGPTLCWVMVRFALSARTSRWRTDALRPVRTAAKLLNLITESLSLPTAF